MAHVVPTYLKKHLKMLRSSAHPNKLKGADFPLKLRNEETSYTHPKP